jgi:hemolysin activation/secretion protein
MGWNLKKIWLIFCLLAAWSANTGFAADTFEIKGYRVEGSTAFSEQQLGVILAPYTGEGKSFDTLREAQKVLTAAYANAGLGMVKITLPPQKSSDGVITLSVKQINVKDITVKGNNNHDEFNILNALPALQTGQTLNTSLLARQIRLSNENPSKQLGITLVPAEDDQINAEIAVTDKRPWKAFATYDNTGTHLTGPSRVSLGFQHTNLFDRDHVFTAQYTTSPNDYGGVHIWGLGYQIPVYSLAHDINFYMAYSDVNSGTLNNLLSVSGKGYIYGVRYQVNFANRGFYKDKLSYGLEYRTLQPSITFSGVQLASPVDLRPFALTYTGSYTEAGKIESNFYVSAVANIPGAEHGKDSDFAANRYKAQADYKLLRIGGSITKALEAGWLARAVVSGQYTEDLLVAAEQFGVGGADSVRGFQEREVIDDKGVQASVELYTPDFFANAESPTNITARGLVFFDAAKVWRNDPLPGEVANENIASYGVGLRVGLGQNLSLKLDYAHVVDGAFVTDEGTDRIHALLVLLY